MPPPVKSYWVAKLRADRKQVQQLASCHFIEHGNSVIVLGPPGWTHPAVSLGLKAIEAGYRVLFTRAANLVAAPDQSAWKSRLDEKLKVFITPRLLIIDEIGYLPINRVGANLILPADQPVVTSAGRRFWPATRALALGSVWWPCDRQKRSPGKGLRVGKKTTLTAFKYLRLYATGPPIYSFPSSERVRLLQFAGKGNPPCQLWQGDL
jgi:hypothetical protein